MKRLVVFIFSVVLFIGCSKKGCTDPNSYNYDTQAAISDTTCIPIIYCCSDSNVLMTDEYLNQVYNFSKLKSNFYKTLNDSIFIDRYSEKVQKMFKDKNGKWFTHYDNYPSRPYHNGKPLKFDTTSYMILPNYIDSLIEITNEGEVIGPFNINNKLFLIKISKIDGQEERYKYRGIFIKAKKDSYNYNLKKRLADSICNVLNYNKDKFQTLFDELGDEAVGSADPRKGIFGWVPYGLNIKELDEFSKNQKIGSFGVIKLNYYGFAITQIIDKKIYDIKKLSILYNSLPKVPKNGEKKEEDK
jgi:hypothetical protein